MYIRKFGLNKKQTARLDKKTGEKKVVPIESFCAEKDYFSFDDESLSNIPQHLRWIHKDLVENYLATFIEGPIDTILCKIIKDRSLTSVSNQEILMLLEWAAWLFIANPTSLAIKSINNITSKFRKIDYLKLCSAERIECFTILHEMITPIFQKRGWILQLIDPMHGRLVSCDRPVMLAGKTLLEQAELSNQTIIFPLSPELLLIGNNNSSWGYASQPLESTQEALLMPNILTLEQSYRFIFASNLIDINNLLRQLNLTTDQP